MADEIGTGVAVDNAASVDDYMSQYEAADDTVAQMDNGPIDVSQDPNQQQQPTQGNQVPQQPAPQQQQPQGGQPQPQQGNGTQAPQTPTGFASRFYRQGEDGSQVFDPQTAHGFLFNQNSPRFTYQDRRQAPQQPTGHPAVPAGQNPQQEEVPAWKKPFVERENYQNAQLDLGLFAVNQMRERLGQNLDPTTAEFLAAQEQAIRQHVRETVVPQWEHEQSMSRAEQAAKDQDRQMNQVRYEGMTQTNIGALANKVGLDFGALQEFLFGHTGPDGKHVGGPATDYVYQMFDLMNPDKGNLTGQDYSNAMVSWWNEFASNPSNLTMLYEMGLARFQRDNWSNLVGQVGATKEQSIRQQNRAQMPSASVDPSPRRTGNGMDAAHQSLHTFLHPQQMQPETI